MVDKDIRVSQPKCMLFNVRSGEGGAQDCAPNSLGSESLVV